MNFELNSIVAAAERQASCDLEGEAAILNVESGIYYSLSGVGSRIWQLLQQPRSVQEIRDTILAEYTVSEAECQADLLRLLTDLNAAGLLQQPDTDAAADAAFDPSPGQTPQS